MTCRLPLLLALLTPSVALAQDASPSLKLPTAVYFASAGADVASSLYTARWGGREANPAVAWMEPRIGTGPMLAVGEAIDVTAVLLLEKWLGRKHPRFAKWALYGAAGMRFYIAAGNVSKGNKYRRYVQSGGIVVNGKGITPMH